MRSPSSKGQGDWPRDVLLCPECGVLGWGHRTNCKSINGPKETVAIVPASSIQGLVEALEEAVDAAQTLALHTYGRSENRDVAEAKERLDRARTALSNYKAVSNGG